MKKRVLLAPVLVVAGVAATGLFIFPLVSPQEYAAPPAPDFGSTVAVRNARLVLPPVAGQPASIQFELNNLGNEVPVALTALTVEHARAVEMVDPDRPVPLKIANVPVEPGETVEFGTGERQVLLAGYDSSVVPGAEVRMILTFGNSGSLTAPLTVVYATADFPTPQTVQK